MARPSIVRRLLDKVRRKKSAPQLAPEPAQEKKPRKRTDSSFEPLEGRIAPAVLLNPNTIQFTDTDGDLITVKFSKAIFKAASDAELNGDLDAVFKFKNASHHVRTSPGGSETDVNELATIDLAALSLFTTDNRAEGTSITITATKSASGDGFVNIGYIRAASSPIFGISLGAVTVDGDLGQIDAGNTKKATGVASLTVRTLGAAGLTSQIDPGGSLESNVTGAIGSLTVLEDWTNATLKVVNGDSSARQPGKIGKLTIGGSLLVSSTNTSADAGLISATGSIGPIKIGTDSTDGIFGGAGANTGQIKALGKITSITISGEIRGGAGKDSGEINGGSIGNLTIGTNLQAGTGENSGRILSGGGMGVVKIGAIVGNQVVGTGDPGKVAGTISVSGNIKSLAVREGISGGKGDNSGGVTVAGTIGKLTIGTSLLGGAGISSGRITAAGIGSATISKTIGGGVGNDSGAILVAGSIGSLVINSDATSASAIIAGTGLRSGGVSAGGNITTVKILGALDGSVTDSKDSGASISAGGHINSLTVFGSLKGGGGELTGSIFAGTIGVAKITGDLIGGNGASSASIIAVGKFKSATVVGSLDGGAGASSASLVAGNDTAIPADFGSVTVTGQLLGDSGPDSASIRAGGKIVKLNIGSQPGPGTSAVDKLKGGTGGNSATIVAFKGIGTANIFGNVVGDAGIGSGSIQAEGLVTSLKITGELKGGAGDGSGTIVSRDRVNGINFTTGDLGTITVVGAVTGGNGIGSGQIFAEGSLKKITVGGLAGGVGDGSGSIVAGRGAAAFANDFQTIGGAGTIDVKGSVTGGPGLGSGSIEAGARIDKLSISGSVTAGSLKSGRDFGAISISGALTDSVISAQGSARATEKADLAIGKLATGSVENSRVLAGYDLFENAVNGNAQIGAVTVSGSWTASSMAAGVVDVDQDGFGDDDDTVIAGGLISKIASITITGAVTGTADPTTDQFAFTAQQIGALKIAGVVQALTASKDTIPLAGAPITNDTSAHEVP
jgi:hypothetical protein